MRLAHLEGVSLFGLPGPQLNGLSGLCCEMLWNQRPASVHLCCLCHPAYQKISSTQVQTFGMQTDRGNKDVLMQALGSRASRSKIQFLAAISYCFCAARLGVYVPANVKANHTLGISADRSCLHTGG